MVRSVREACAGVTRAWCSSNQKTTIFSHLLCDTFFFFFLRMSGKESRADLSRRRRRAGVVYVDVTGAWCSSGQKS